MKLQTRFLLIPVSIAVVLMLLTVALWMNHGADRQAMAGIRIADDAATSMQAIRAGAAEAALAASRLMVGGDEAKLAEARAKLIAQRSAAIDASEALARSADAALARSGSELRSAADKAFAKSLEAADRARSDGASAAAGAALIEQELGGLAKLAAQSAVRAREAALAGEQAVLDRGARIVWVVAGSSLAAVIIIVLFCLRQAGRVARSLDSARDFVSRVAEGDLTAALRNSSDGELADLQKALNAMQGSLRTMVSDVRQSVDGIGTAASEIAVGNNDLSARTEAQASSLQETASSMDQLTQTVRSNADSARQANQLALSASEVAERGGMVVSEVVQRMDSITASSRRIAEIIGVIDGIAFQTNILALNAAVEAARAGEQGRGFAVVAGEVRSLAQRSADAAREIKDLITASVTEVDNGSKLVKSAGSTMEEIVSSVRRVTDIIGEISAATGEQSMQIGQVNGAVNQLDQMTQQNAALVEQSTAASESLKDQARNLGRAVSVFRLDGYSAPAQSVSASPAKASRTPSPSAPARRPSPAKIVVAEPAPKRVAPAVSAATLPAPSSASRTPSRPAASPPPAASSAAPPAAAGSPSPRLPVNEDDWETF